MNALQKIISLCLFIILSGCSSVHDTPTLTPPVPHQVTRPLKIGVLLPLKGDHKDLGSMLQKTAAMAYFKGLKDKNVVLVFENTQGTEAGAKIAFQKVLNQKVDAIVGPVFAHEALCLQKAFPHNTIPVFSLSNNSSSAGKSVYTMGLNPINSMTESLRFAAKQGIKTLSALLPKSAYGQQLRQALPGIAHPLGLQLKEIKMYSPQNPYTYGDISFEGIDALFLPEGVPNGAKILEALFHQGTDLSHIRLIGSAQWEGMPVMPEHGWFTAPDLDKGQAFIQEYACLYEQHPPKVAIILYDALFLVSTLRQLYGARPFTKENLQQPAGFMGLEGPFKITVKNNTIRSLAVYEVVNGQPQKVQDVAIGF